MALENAKVVGLVLQTTWTDAIRVSVSSQSNEKCAVVKHLSIANVGHDDDVTVHVVGVRA